jgi:hypothetical protein
MLIAWWATISTLPPQKEGAQAHAHTPGRGGDDLSPGWAVSCIRCSKPEPFAVFSRRSVPAVLRSADSTSINAGSTSPQAAAVRMMRAVASALEGRAARRHIPLRAAVRQVARLGNRGHWAARRVTEALLAVQSFPVSHGASMNSPTRWRPATDYKGWLYIDHGDAATARCCGLPSGGLSLSLPVPLGRGRAAADRAGRTQAAGGGLVRPSPDPTGGAATARPGGVRLGVAADWSGSSAGFG